MVSGQRWTVQDRQGHDIYLTEERWQHIIEPINHPEMAMHEEHLRETIRSGIRKQDPLNPRKYRSTKPFDDLASDNTHRGDRAVWVRRRVKRPTSAQCLHRDGLPEGDPLRATMQKPVLNYDEVSDTLYISFSPNELATGIELNDHILLRINKPERRAIGVTFFDYSVLAQQTEIGPRSFPLTGLAALSSELREIVLDILRRPPVSDILLLSSYTPSISETVPITVLQPMDILAA